MPKAYDPAPEGTEDRLPYEVKIKGEFASDNLTLYNGDGPDTEIEVERWDEGSTYIDLSPDHLRRLHKVIGQRIAFLDKEGLG